MYSENPVVNDIVLAVINDGNGSQCGMTYEQRCVAAEHGLADYRVACAKYGKDGRVALDERPATRAEVIEAASLVQKYYRNHMAEAAQHSPR